MKILLIIKISILLFLGFQIIFSFIDVGSMYILAKLNINKYDENDNDYEIIKNSKNSCMEVLNNFSMPYYVFNTLFHILLIIILWSQWNV